MGRWTGFEVLVCILYLWVLICRLFCRTRRIVVPAHTYFHKQAHTPCHTRTPFHTHILSHAHTRFHTHTHLFTHTHTTYTPPPHAHQSRTYHVDIHTHRCVYFERSSTPSVCIIAVHHTTTTDARRAVASGTSPSISSTAPCLPVWVA